MQAWLACTRELAGWNKGIVFAFHAASNFVRPSSAASWASLAGKLCREGRAPLLSPFLAESRGLFYVAVQVAGLPVLPAGLPCCLACTPG